MSEKGFSFYNQSMYGYKKSTLRDEAKKMAALLEEKEKEKAKFLVLEEEKRRQEEELGKLRERQRLQQEKEFKTKRFFDLNNFDHKILPIGNPYYYGDFQLKFAAWRPHGKGQLCLFDNPVLDGDWVRGNFVKGKITWSDGSCWEGGIQHEVIHGMGKFTNPQGETEEVVAVYGEILVKRSEFAVGAQLEFLETHFNNYIVDGRYPRATIIKLVKDWKCFIRFHEEVWPRERIIDLSTVGKFRFLKHCPRILDLNAVDLKSDAGRLHDYRAHIPHVTKRDLLLTVPTRRFEDRRTNLFESRMVGIGATQEEEDEKEKIRLKKLQWASVMAEGKQRLIAEKQRLIEAEQERQYELKAMDKREEEEKQRELDDEATQSAIDDELQRIEDEYSQASSKTL